MKAILWTLQRLPLRALHWMGNTAGWLAWTFRRRDRQLALLNLGLCFPEHSPAQRRRLARASFTHYYKQLFECPMVWGGDMDYVRGLTVEVRGLDKFESALADGKGVILAAMHAGSFEVGVIPMSSRYTMWGMYKPFKWPLIEDLARRGRTRFGARVEPIVRRQGKNGIGSQLLRALKRGEIIFALPDRDPPRGQGIFAPFFGIDAHSPVMIPRLVQITGAKLLIVVGERLPNSRGFVTHFLEPPEGYDSPDVATAVGAINLGLENWVRQHPEQWWWGYKRFKRRPWGERCFYRGHIQLPKPHERASATADAA